MEGEAVVKARIPIGLAFAGGLVVGALAGFLGARYTGRQELDKRIEEGIRDEIADVKAHYDARIEDIVLGSQLAGKGGDRDERTAGPVGTRRGFATVVDSDQPAAGTVQYSRRPHQQAPGDQAGLRGAVPDAGPDEAADDEDGGGRNPDAILPGPGPIEDVVPWPAEDPGDRADESSVPSLTGETPDISIITRTEFHDDTEVDHRKLTLTFYDADKVLVDEKDVPIRDNANVVGTDFVSLFGESSDDPDIVYVRNTRLRLDFQIIRREEGFAQAVLGYGGSQ